MVGWATDSLLPDSTAASKTGCTPLVAAVGCVSATLAGCFGVAAGADGALTSFLRVTLLSAGCTPLVAELAG